MELLLHDVLLAAGVDSDGRPSAAANRASLLVREGRVAWVGPPEQAPEGPRVDLAGRLVTPAFVDAHVHLAETGQQALAVDLTGATSAADLLALVSGHAAHADAADPSGGTSVVLGHGWDETTWQGGTTVTREDLDRATRGRPAYLSRIDMHSALVTTSLVEAAGGSRLAALAGWSARGPLAQDAHHAVRDAARSLVSPEDRARAIATALDSAAAAGMEGWNRHAESASKAAAADLVDIMGAPHPILDRRIIYSRG